MRIPGKGITRSAMLAMLVAASLAIAAWGLVKAPSTAPQAHDSNSGDAGSARLWLTALRKDELVKDLKKEELRLFVGKEEQTIQGLTLNPPGPLNLGLVIDVSGSRRNILPGAETDLAPDFFRGLLIKPGDQVFIVVFSDKAYLETDLTDNEQQIDAALQRAAAHARHGGTALYDTLFSACDQRSPTVGKHRALVVVTDGEDNSSYHTRAEATALIRQTGTILYVVAPEGGPSSTFRGYGRRVPLTEILNQLAAVSGGMLFKITNKDEMARAFTFIAEVLRSQYRLEFQPANLRVKKPQRIRIECSRRGVKVIAPDEWLEP